MPAYDTIGIEVETDAVTKPRGSHIARELNGAFIAGRDASIETQVYITRDGMKLLDRNYVRSSLNRDTMGVEFISSPLAFADFKVGIRNLTGLLKTYGEPEVGTRSSIHIHIGYNTRKSSSLKRLLKLFFNVEPLFYRLGGMGYPFRGLSNNSIYCRPLTHKFGPPVVGCEDGNFYHLFKPLDLLAAKTIDSFWYTMAIEPGNSGRYHPSRYFGLNLYSTLLHGTVEFRYFNKTLDHTKIVAVASLCQSIVEWAEEGSDEINAPDFPLEDKNSLLFLYQLLKGNSNYRLSEKTLYILEEMVSSTESFKIQERFVKSHLLEKWSLPERYLMNYERERVSLRDAIDSGFIDIHRINGNYDLLNSII